jgi:hypothetical protein
VVISFVLAANKQIIEKYKPLRGVKLYGENCFLCVVLTIAMTIIGALVASFSLYLIWVAMNYIKPALFDVKGIAKFLQPMPIPIPALGESPASVIMMDIEEILRYAIVVLMFVVPAVNVALASGYVSSALFSMMSPITLVFDESCDGISVLTRTSKLFQNGPAGCVEYVIVVMILQSFLLGFVCMINVHIDQMLKQNFDESTAVILETLLDGVLAGFMLMTFTASSVLLYKHLKRESVKTM